MSSPHEPVSAQVGLGPAPSALFSWRDDMTDFEKENTFNRLIRDRRVHADTMDQSITHSSLLGKHDHRIQGGKIQPRLSTGLTINGLRLVPSSKVDYENFQVLVF